MLITTLQGEQRELFSFPRSSQKDANDFSRNGVNFTPPLDYKKSRLTYLFALYSFPSSKKKPY